MIDKLINVLNNGYVRLADVFGSDLSVVNAARCSYGKESQQLTESDKRLIKFLATHRHESPFRHCFATFEIKAPLVVARQWYKYRVGSTHSNDTSNTDGQLSFNNGDDGGDCPMQARNEASRRYITMEPEFYVPTTWRLSPANSKQGSSGPASDDLSLALTKQLRDYIKQGEDLYNKALQANIAPEQARLFLPAYALHTVWRWTASIQSIAHLLNQRLEHDAQLEFQEYARAVYELIEPHFPTSIGALVNGTNNSGSPGH
jgi:thymidylate synthase (FAD)